MGEPKKMSIGFVQNTHIKLNIYKQLEIVYMQVLNCLIILKQNILNLTVFIKIYEIHIAFSFHRYGHTDTGSITGGHTLHASVFFASNFCFFANKCLKYMPRIVSDR